MVSLSKYRGMRDFERTPEPSGAERTPQEGERPRFVVQEHHARRLHWDFRLERDGVLVSWAVPRGIPPAPSENHLAVHTEDHPLSYIAFEGEIPAGNYGAGRVILWDQGWYETEKFRDDEVIVVLHGKRVSGKYALFQTKGTDWMIHRMDPPQDPSREPMPDRVAPMLPTLVKDPPTGAGWAFEVKWDGVRAIAFVSGGRVRLESRNLLDITRQYPELTGLGEEMGARPAVFDGEIVAFDDSGRPSFERLQQRMGLGSDSVIRRRRKETPVVYLIFDVLYLDEHSTMALPYEERRKLLDGFGLHGDAWRVPAYHVGDGRALLGASKEQGLEGLVAKQLRSAYEPGRRTRTWVKVKNKLAQEFVIGGFTPGEGSRASTIGALLLGYYEGKKLHYAGKVGTGLTEKFLRELLPALEKIEQDETPFATGRPPRGSRYVQPVVVCEAEFTEWTKGGMVRHPSFKGLRVDKPAIDVTRELPAEEP